MKIGIACDHAGFNLKEIIISFLKDSGIEFDDYGTFECESVDYPDYGLRVAEAVSKCEVERGILICGTGIGMSIVANKVSGVRAALCNDLFTAKMSRLHNDANVLTIGGRIVGADLAREIVNVWLNTPFEGGRHSRRVEKIMEIERKLRSKR
ncbi:MAG: ribose 5-phosphate isomerase B [Nitrospirota bacterium]